MCRQMNQEEIDSTWWNDQLTSIRVEPNDPVYASDVVTEKAYVPAPPQNKAAKTSVKVPGTATA